MLDIWIVTNSKGQILIGCYYITMNSTLGVQTREEEEKVLQDCSDQEDLFSVYIRLIIAHAPPFYVFINITIVIWVAQNILSSKLNAIPNSLYLLSPYFTANPFSQLSLVPSTSACEFGSSLLVLKSFPTIYSNHIFHRKLTNWREDSLKFCARKISFAKKVNSCEENQILCSGYCVDSSTNCPITKLRISDNLTVPIGFEKIYQSNGKSYQISRVEGTPIVGITASYETRCANDEYYNKAFDNESQYWAKVSDCGNEGKVSTFFNQVDDMETNSFFAANNLSITTTQPEMQKILLGTVGQFQLSKEAGNQCTQAYEEMKKVKNYLNNSPAAPQFSQSLLIISFILLILEVIWLAFYYCFPGGSNWKNMLAMMFSIIELVVIGFIYNGNSELFKIEQISKIMTKCLSQSVPAFKEWDFGLESPEVFQMVLFANTVFLGLYLSSLLFDYVGFEQYKRIAVHLPRLQGNNNL